MTLRRKNLAPHQLIVGIYAAMLFCGFCVTTYDLLHEGCFFLCHVLGNCGFLMRLGGRWSKFVVWPVVCVIYLTFTLFLVEVEPTSLAVDRAGAYNSRIGWAAEDLLLPLLSAAPDAVRSFMLASASSVQVGCIFLGGAWDHTGGSSSTPAEARQRGQTAIMGALFVLTTASKMILGRKITAARAVKDAAKIQ